ncbi:MAG: hypothetical protein LC740_06720 [Actinobacteria bacterium]|nr:hypothetical protein [Actinomycetota bacterium]
MSGRSRRGGSGTSWASVLIGWLAALGTSLILSGLVTAVVGAILATLGFGGGSEAATTSFIGILVTLFLAFLIGGYAAGRMASRQGTRHGLLVALLALIVTLVLTLTGLGLTNNLQSVTLPGVPSEVTQQGLGTVLTVGGVLALLLPFVGGAIGGAWGESSGRRRP